MTYQSFPDEGAGHSDSSSKLAALKLPEVLTGKSILDVGCNEGFFCFEAKKRGAEYVLGIDKYKPYIDGANERAKKYGLDVNFMVGECSDVVEIKFDIILVLSVLHYIPDPAIFFDRVFSLLNPGGFLVFEGGVIEDTRETLFRVFRDDRDYTYPTESFLKNIWLSKFNVKKMGRSIFQPGDPVPRSVFHCHASQSIYFSSYEFDLEGKYKTTQSINVDDIIFPKKPRSLSRVTDEQKVLFSAIEEANGDVGIAWDKSRRVSSTFDYAVQSVVDLVNRNRGVPNTVLYGQTADDLVDAVSKKLSYGVEVFRITRSGLHEGGDNSDDPVITTIEGTTADSQIDAQTLSDATDEIKRRGPEAWAIDFVLKNRNPNIGLYKIIKKNKFWWFGPCKIALHRITVMAGPGKKYHEDEDLWNRRAEELIARIDSSEDLPPAIGFAVDDEFNNEELFTVKLADGAHRWEALRRMGENKIPILVWFKDRSSMERFEDQYNMGLYG